MSRMLDWREETRRHLEASAKPLIVVLGPTGSGKTALSIDVARFILDELKRPAEVVNADSRQLYRGLDIGTAKVTTEEARGVPHRLLSVLDPQEELSVARYREMAVAEIDAILAAGGVPLLVGGSMLYLSAVIDGLQPLPPADPALRSRLENAYDADGGVSLYALLSELDPETAAAFHPNNKPYVIRAMEIIESSGKPASAQKTSTGCPYDLLILGIERPRAETTARIEKRTPILLASGWVEEVARLRAEGATEKTPAMKSHGYREILRALERGLSIDETKRDDAVRGEIDAKTRQYAKRQVTWWKRDPRIRWIQTA